MAQVDKGVPEQQTTIVAQLEAELANAKAYGDKGRAERVERQLKDLGVKKAAAEKRAEAKPEKKDEPEGRHSGKSQHTA